MQMTSMFLKSCSCSAQEAMLPPEVSACALCCSWAGWREGLLLPGPKSQVKNRPCAACNPGHFPTAPLCLLPPHCSLTAKALLKHFQINYFLCSGFSVPERTFSWKGSVIQHWSDGKSFSQSTGDTHLATCFAWFRSGAWPWFSHVLDEWPNHWAIKAITSALWPY